MIDKIYYALRNYLRGKEMTKSRYDIKIEDLLKKPVQPTQVVDKNAKVDPANPEAGKVTPEEIEDRKDKEVEIPVGGITDDGTIYEKVVRPDGNEPIYKEVHIDNEIDTPTVTEKETPAKTNPSDTTDE